MNRAQFADVAVRQSPFHTSRPGAVDVAEHLCPHPASLYGGDDLVCRVGIQCHRLVKVDVFPGCCTLRADAPAPFYFRAKAHDMHIVARECRVQIWDERQVEFLGERFSQRYPFCRGIPFIGECDEADACILRETPRVVFLVRPMPAEQ